MGFRDVLGSLGAGHVPARVAAQQDRRRRTTFAHEIPPEMLEGRVAGGIAARIHRAEALQVPAVLRSRNLIAGTLGSLPHTVHDRDRREVPTTYLLGGNIDPDVPNAVTWSSTYEDLLFEGISWWRVTDLGWHGFPVHARHVPEGSVHVAGTARAVDWVSEDQRIPVNGKVFIDGEHVPDDQIIRFDSPNPPLLIHAARAIRTALKLDRNAATYSDDPLPLGMFTPDEGADPGDDEIDDALDDWEESRRTRAWGYVGAALKPHVLQWSPEQLQLADARQHAVLEIARAAGIDPEDLGVSTTSRTYQNSEQRRQDLLDFTLGAYVTAVQDRLSMHDVLPRGYVARVKFGGFLRSDTKTRVETYEIGQRVGAYTGDEIRELEDRPALTPAEKRALADRSRPPAPAAPDTDRVRQEAGMAPATFTTDTTTDTVVSFDSPEVAAAFRVNPEKRTISGLAVPWGPTARAGFARWRFRKGSLRWTSSERVKLLRDHDVRQPVGRAVRLDVTDAGLEATFKIARGPAGDEVLSLAEDGVLDGFSVGVDFEDGGEWQPDPADESVRLVNAANLREVTITAMPSFDGARVDSVAAARNTEGIIMGDTTAAVDTPAPPAGSDLATFQVDLTTAVGKAVGDAMAAAFATLGIDPEDPQNIRETVKAGRATPNVKVISEPPIYRLNGSGPSFVKDAWTARQDRSSAGDEADARLRKYSEQSAEFTERQTALKFVESRATDPAIIPPGYRPDLYVGQLPQGRPLTESCSQGTLTDATPFTLPRFVSATGATANHVEGTNPTPGSLAFEPVTVTPGATSGLLELTRELVDSSNPQIDRIALDAMRESYSQQTEAKVYTELNGANGQGGVITAGFVPSGAQAAVSSGQGDELLAATRGALAVYPFRRFASPSIAHLSQEGTVAYATAVGTDGRPLLPSLGAENTVGMGNAVTQGWFVDGLANVPSWSMIGNAAGDADVLMWNRADAWCWESALLTFRYEERNGPAQVDLALFGYFATRLLRPRGLSAIRHTAA